MSNVFCSQTNCLNTINWAQHDAFWDWLHIKNKKEMKTLLNVGELIKRASENGTASVFLLNDTRHYHRCYSTFSHLHLCKGSVIAAHVEKTHHLWDQSGERANTKTEMKLHTRSRISWGERNAKRAPLWILSYNYLALITRASLKLSRETRDVSRRYFGAWGIELSTTHLWVSLKPHWRKYCLRCWWINQRSDPSSTNTEVWVICINHHFTCFFIH